MARNKDLSWGRLGQLKDGSVRIQVMIQDRGTGPKPEIRTTSRTVRGLAFEKVVSAVGDALADLLEPDAEHEKDRKRRVLRKGEGARLIEEFLRANGPSSWSEIVSGLYDKMSHWSVSKSIRGPLKKRINKMDDGRWTISNGDPCEEEQNP